MNATESKSADVVAQTAKWLCIFVFCYWASMALLAPVTIWDAHVYNLGRLPLTVWGGLWDNPYWTTERQLVFPWTFDAIHLPLLSLRWGYALPSFLCFMGICIIAWVWVNELRGKCIAWLTVLGFLSMPMLVFQATGTKNDIAVVFGVGVWVHGMLRWQRTRGKIHLAFAALGLAFAAGSKTSGLPLAVLASGLSLIVLRCNRNGALVMLVTLIVGMFFCGSIETYVASFLRHDHPLGSLSFQKAHRNPDGLKGAAANSVRYIYANMATGTEPFQEDPGHSPFWEEACRNTLKMMGLRDVGYRFDFSDETFSVNRMGMDAASDFGATGSLCLAIAMFSLFRWRPQSAWWRLAVAGTVCWALVCLLVAWMPWNNRFLLLPFVFWTAALAMRARHPASHWILLAVFGYGTVIYPLFSFNKRPRDLARALQARVEQQFVERPTLLPIWHSTISWRKSNPNGRMYLFAGSDSWVLPFLNSHELKMRPVASTLSAERIGSIRENDIPVALLVVNRDDLETEKISKFRLVQSFTSESGSSLWESLPQKTDNPMPSIVFEGGFFADGWTAEKAVIRTYSSESGEISLALWNPTALKRNIVIKADHFYHQTELQAHERRTIKIGISQESDRIVIESSPPHLPPNDPRKLGLRITVDSD